MKTIGIVTSGRADFGLYTPLLDALSAKAGLEVKLIATGMHLLPQFGSTVRLIEEAGYPVFERVENHLNGDSPEAVAAAMGEGVRGFSRLFSQWRPDILTVLGDRFDMYPAAVAALPFRIPVAHIAGGEITEGAIDDALRHSLTKLSHLHFAATEAYAQRLLQMGEEPWRVTVSGALAVDNIQKTKRLSPGETAEKFGLNPRLPTFLVTYHPETLKHEQTRDQISALLTALGRRKDAQIFFTYPNADTGGRAIIEAIEKFRAGNSRARVVKNAGISGYLSLMGMASAMVGNSSSGIIEAPSFELPVINIGQRQAGRIRAANVIDCECETDRIQEALQQALDPEFREGLRGLKNPYGDGHAAEKIAARLAETRDLEALIWKKFMDLKKVPA